MKKTLSLAAIAISLSALVLIGAMVALFAVAGGQAGTKTTQRAVQLDAYIQENWQPYRFADYDAATSTLTLRVDSTMTYAQACSFGGEIYTDSLALPDYAPTLAQIVTSAAAECEQRPRTAVLQGYSADGVLIFTVGSDGAVWCCWEDS